MSKEKNTASAVRISNSFSPGEIQVMDFVLMTLLRGGDAKMAVRAKEFGSLCKKVSHMKKKAEELRGGPLAPVVDAAKEGSGIVVRADQDDATPAEAAPPEAE